MRLPTSDRRSVFGTMRRSNCIPEPECCISEEAWESVSVQESDKERASRRIPSDIPARFVGSTVSSARGPTPCRESRRIQPVAGGLVHLLGRLAITCPRGRREENRGAGSHDPAPRASRCLRSRIRGRVACARPGPYTHGALRAYPSKKLSHMITFQRGRRSPRTPETQGGRAPSDPDAKRRNGIGRARP